MLVLEGNTQLVPSIDFICDHDERPGQGLQKIVILVSYQKLEREIRSSLFPGVHYPVRRQKPMCNLYYLYRGVVQKRALTFTQEVRKAPDPWGDFIQSTLQQLNNHPTEAHHCANTVKFPLLNAEEGINRSEREKSSCMLRCTEPAFWLCSLHELCSQMCPARDLLCGRGM